MILEDTFRVKYLELKAKYLGHTCRKCINSGCGTRFNRRDCYYEFYTNDCSICGERHNIVKDIRKISRYKLILKKDKLNREPRIIEETNV